MMNGEAEVGDDYLDMALANMGYTLPKPSPPTAQPPQQQQPLPKQKPAPPVANYVGKAPNVVAPAPSVPKSTAKPKQSAHAPPVQHASPKTKNSTSTTAKNTAKKEVNKPTDSKPNKKTQKNTESLLAKEEEEEGKKASGNDNNPGDSNGGDENKDTNEGEDEENQERSEIERDEDICFCGWFWCCGWCSSCEGQCKWFCKAFGRRCYNLWTRRLCCCVHKLCLWLTADEEEQAPTERMQEISDNVRVNRCCDSAWEFCRLMLGSRFYYSIAWVLGIIAVWLWIIAFGWSQYFFYHQYDIPSHHQPHTVNGTALSMPPSLHNDTVAPFVPKGILAAHFPLRWYHALPLILEMVSFLFIIGADKTREEAEERLDLHDPEKRRAYECCLEIKRGVMLLLSISGLMMSMYWAVMVYFFMEATHEYYLSMLPVCAVFTSTIFMAVALGCAARAQCLRRIEREEGYGDTAGLHLS